MTRFMECVERDNCFLLAVIGSNRIIDYLTKVRKLNYTKSKITVELKVV